MKITKMIAVNLLLFVNIFASSLIVTSDVTSNTSWDADTVIINKEFFEIKEGARLTIGSGVHVIFKKDIAVITVKGTISALGTVDDSVYFSKEKEGEWQGIRIVPRSNSSISLDSSFFEYCSLKKSLYFGSSNSFDQMGGVLHCGKGNFVLIKGCGISDVQGQVGGAVYVDSGSVMKIVECTFLSNSANSFGGGAVMTSDSGFLNLIVQNSSFKYNSARNGGAVRIGKGTKAEFNNCIFFKDSTISINPALKDLNGGAIAIFGAADVTMRNCIIFHCRSYVSGGGIYSRGASLKLINCTVAQNTTIYGGGIYFARGVAASSPILVNTIVDGNGKLFGVSIPRDSAGCAIFLDSSVTPVFRNCQMSDTIYDHTIQKYTGEFTNSRYCKTEFVHSRNTVPDTIVDGYVLYTKLSKKDPAIDSGTPDTTGLGLPEFDVAGRKRINGTAIDIGALEYHENITSIHTLSPYRKTEQLRSSDNRFSIYSLNGQKLGNYKSGVALQTVHQFVRNRFPKGIYLVTLCSSGKQVQTEKIMVK